MVADCTSAYCVFRKVLQSVLHFILMQLSICSMYLRHFVCLSLRLLLPFPYLRSANRVSFLHVLWSCVILCNITPPQFRSSYLSVFLSFGLSVLRCPPTSIFHVLITTSSSVFLSTRPNHISLTSLIFSLMFATPALALISSVLIFFWIILNPQ